MYTNLIKAIDVKILSEFSEDVQWILLSAEIKKGQGSLLFRA